MITFAIDSAALYAALTAAKMFVSRKGDDRAAFGCIGLTVYQGQVRFSATDGIAMCLVEPEHGPVMRIQGDTSEPIASWAPGVCLSGVVDVKPIKPKATRMKGGKHAPQEYLLAQGEVTVCVKDDVTTVTSGAKEVLRIEHESARMPDLSKVIALMRPGYRFNASVDAKMLEGLCKAVQEWRMSKGHPAQVTLHMPDGKISDCMWIEASSRLLGRLRCCLAGCDVQGG